MNSLKQLSLHPSQFTPDDLLAALMRGDKTILITGGDDLQKIALDGYRAAKTALTTTKSTGHELTHERRVCDWMAASITLAYLNQEISVQRVEVSA